MWGPNITGLRCAATASAGFCPPLAARLFPMNTRVANGVPIAKFAGRIEQEDIERSGAGGCRTSNHPQVQCFEGEADFPTRVRRGAVPRITAAPGKSFPQPQEHLGQARFPRRDGCFPPAIRARPPLSRDRSGNRAIFRWLPLITWRLFRRYTASIELDAAGASAGARMARRGRQRDRSPGSLTQTRSSCRNMGAARNRKRRKRRFRTRRHPGVDQRGRIPGGRASQSRFGHRPPSTITRLGRGRNASKARRTAPDRSMGV